MRSRLTRPEDYTTLETPEVREMIARAGEISGEWRGIRWRVRRFSEKRYQVTFWIAGHEGSGTFMPTVAEAIYLVHVTCYRLGKEKT